MNPDKIVYQGDDGVSVTAVLSHLDGTPINLTNAISTSFIMQTPTGVINKSATVVDAQNGVVRYTLDSTDIASVGDYSFVWRVNFPGGSVTYPTSGPLTLRVLPDVDSTTPEIMTFVTTDEVFAYTAKNVSTANIINAQTIIGAIVDRDLSDPSFISSLSVNDDRRLSQAVSFQAAENSKLSVVSTSAMDISQLPEGITSIRQGDVSLTFGGTSGTNSSVESLLTPLTLRLLSKLSWLNPRTIKPVSMFDERQYVWNYDNTFANQPIIRGMPLDDMLWEQL